MWTVPVAFPKSFSPFGCEILSLFSHSSIKEHYSGCFPPLFWKMNKALLTASSSLAREHVFISPTLKQNQTTFYWFNISCQLIIPFSNPRYNKTPQMGYCFANLSLSSHVYSLRLSHPIHWSNVFVDALPTRGMRSRQGHGVLSFIGSPNAAVLKLEISKHGGFQVRFALGPAKYIAHCADDLHTAKINERFPTCPISSIL